MRVPRRRGGWDGAALLLVLATACGGAPRAGSPSAPETGGVYASVPARTMFESSVRVRVGCFDGTGSIGSGVAISKRHVLTAKHVVQGCGQSREPKLIVATIGDGETAKSYEMVVDELAPEVDAVRLVAVQAGSPFRRWAPIGFARPLLGQEVCTVGGDGQAGLSVMKCGRVSSRGEGWILTAIPLVHGNSGGPVFDGQGRVLALWTRGTVTPGQENIGIAVPSTSWRDLIVTQSSDDVAAARSIGF